MQEMRIDPFRRLNRQRARQMTADALFDDLGAIRDRYGLPIELDGSEGRIPIICRHLAWELYVFPHTFPVRVECRGELPDRVDQVWAPLWRLLERWESMREAVRPLSSLGYRLLDSDAPVTPLQELMRKR